MRAAQQLTHLETVMGIPMSVDLRDPGDWSATVREAFDYLGDADRRFSTYRPDSELYAVNAGTLASDDYSEQLREVLAIAHSYETRSGGAFSVWSDDGRLDTDGVVKGWAAQGAADILVRRGAKNFCLNAGGDVVVRGCSQPGSNWNVGVRSPWTATEMLAVLSVTDAAVATSGSYERGAHILDRRTGRAATGLSSVTVIAKSLTMADVLATTVFALGLAGVGWAVDGYDCAVLAVTPDGRFVMGGEVPLAAVDG